MSGNVEWTTLALRQLGQIELYLSALNPGAATSVVVAIVSTAEGLAHFPHRGRAIPHSRAREIVTAYPYIIRYRVEQQTVTILRIRHTSRRPVRR